MPTSRELRIARGAVRELEAKVFSQEQAIKVLRNSVASYQRDMADPPAYLQDAVIKAAGLGAMAEQIAALKKQVEALTRQPLQLAWLYSHCQAIGMDCKSDSGKLEDDICLWTINLTEKIKELQQIASEPYGHVTTTKATGQQFFYRYPESPYLDNVKECVAVYTLRPSANWIKG